MPSASDSPSRLRGGLRELGATLNLAIPIVTGFVATNATNLADTAIATQIGIPDVAGLGLSFFAMLLFQSALYGILAPFTTHLATAHGRGDPHAFARWLARGLRTSPLIGLLLGILYALTWLALPSLGQPPDAIRAALGLWLLFALQITLIAPLIVIKEALEACGRPWRGLKLMLTYAAISPPLAALLAIGFEFGLIGIGIAQALAVFAALLLGMRELRRLGLLRRKEESAPLSGWIWRLGTELRASLIEGVPLGFLFLSETGAVTLAVVFIGWKGAVPLAANQILSSLTQILYMLPLGFSLAAAVRIGQLAGAGETLRLHRAAWAVVLASGSWMALSAAIIMLLGPSYAAALTDEPEILNLVAAGFVVIALFQIADGLQSVAVGVLRGLKDFSGPAWISLIAYWGVALPLSYAGAQYMDNVLVGAWGGFGAGLMVAALLLLWRTHRRLPPLEARS